MKMNFLIAFSALCVIASSCAQTNRVEAKKSELDVSKEQMSARIDSVLTPYVEELRARTNNNAGLAIGITKGNEIIYVNTFGYANIEQAKKADLTTVFHIASVSKPFTATAIMKLVEQGKVKLDDHIVDHLPEFEMKGEAYKDITIEQVLTHTSGIPRHISNGDWLNPVYGDQADKQTLTDAKNHDLDFEPGSTFSYSNSAFDILGLLIGRVSGMRFEEYVQKYILKPAGMNHSYFIKPKGSLPADWAVPYSYGVKTQEWSPYPYSENYFPSSGLQTTILDMCRWGILNANRGEMSGKTVIDESYFSQLSEPHFDTPWGDKIGLSWFLQSYMDRPIIMHQGNDTGFEALTYIYPEDSISITVLANRDFSRTGRIINAASEVVFNHPPKEYSVSAKYPFTDAYLNGGIDSAIQKWEALKSDTTDIYYIAYDDVLTTGAVLENGKEWKASKEILEYYLTIDDQSTYAWRLLGNANLNLGNLDEAQKCYEQTLIINPDYEKGRKALEELLELRKRKGE